MTGVRGQPLSVRLALLLALAVVAVLLITGFAVNRLVSRGLADELGSVQRDRIEFLAAQLNGIDLDEPRIARAVHQAMQRIVRQTGGRMVLLEDGREVLEAGRVPEGESERVEEPVPGGDLTLAVDVPTSGPAFLGVFNVTLLVAGVLAVGALVVAAALLSDRLTRPLRGVAAAARRLGGGDLSARAEGGPDRESAELAEAFNTMAAQLQRSEELRRRAASDMAHDLATPATVLESQLQAMLDGVVPADRVELERARAAAGAMSGVIVQLRELVDVEAAATQRAAAPTPVNELLDEVATALAPYFRERDVRLVIEAGPATVVHVDPNQVGRALRNVLVNACQHSPPQGEVLVTTDEGTSDVVVRVRDQGPGIATDDLPHVFERFYRADPARPGDGPRAGSGIGLTIARELLAANRGRIEVESTGPAGTTFALRLPRSG